jgi:sulfide dehydrogenase cytochrome subunit
MTHPSIYSVAQQLAAACLAASAMTAAHAQQTAEQLHQRTTAAMCANCHGSEGRTVEGSAIPALAGMPKDDMLRHMKAFKDGSRPATVMHQITKGLTDAQIETLATYYANTKR